MTTETPPTEGSAEPPVDAGLARHGGISYLHLPATDVRAAAVFYEAAFGWVIHNRDTPRPGFEDGTGHVGGAWVTNQEISRQPALLPYIYVDDADKVAARIVELGGEIVQPPYDEGNLRVGTFRDPAGNVLGIWSEPAS
jgi:predicted enzyme related to lactoylglutathione lyase